MFGAGGGTSSYLEVEQADVILLFGSNARDAHPIFFHHVIKALRRGARLFVVDPRRTSTAAWADVWLPIQVGGDIALANAMGQVIVEEGLVHTSFVANATTGFEAWRDSIAAQTPETTATLTGVDPATVREVARAFAKADRAIIGWTLGITEHANAVDNVLALINLALATGHVGRFGSGLNPLRGQNNVQGGGDMGALPHKLPGFLDVEDPVHRARCEEVWGASIPPIAGWHLTEMFEAMERRELRALWVLGENPARSEANGHHTVAMLRGLDHLVVQDMFLTQTAELADVVLPATAAWCEADGTVTNSERRVQRCRKAVEPPLGARDDIEILSQVAALLGTDLRLPSPHAAWEELRKVSPMHAGMSWERLEALGGLQWPCPTDDHPGQLFLHGRLWEQPRSGPAAPFHVVAWQPIADPLDDEYPLLLTTGRKLDAYNTGVQSAWLGSPLTGGEALELGPVDARKLNVTAGDLVRIRSRRGEVTAPVRIDPTLRAGLVFMTFHCPDQVDTNLLTIDATDPKAGTAEFKATAVCVDPIRPVERAGVGPSPAK